MADYICIDGGTTNTRICLVQDHRVTATRKLALGAGSAEGSQAFVHSLRREIAQLLAENRLSREGFQRILASGMITSEQGLYELPHIPAPADISALHRGMQEVLLPHICPIPFVFIPGVRQSGTTVDTTDMMRGEETELMGLFSGEGLYILSGSHTKLIQIGPDRTIRSFRTMLTGEMLAALAQNTILKNAVTLQAHPADPEHLHMGYCYAMEYGLNEALFKVRVLKNLFHKTPGQLYHFYLGAVLSQEVQAILRQQPKRIILCGQEAIKEALAALLPMLWEGEITVITAQEAAHAAPLGMVRIYEHTP